MGRLYATIDLPAGTLDGFLAWCRSVNGMVKSTLWVVGCSNCCFARQSVLEANGIRIPTLDDPWSLEEFDAALETLASNWRV